MLRLLWLLIVGNWPRPAPPPPRCIVTECKAPPSPLCWDKRCRKHCSDAYACGCERKQLSRDEALALAEYRRAVQ